MALYHRNIEFNNSLGYDRYEVNDVTILKDLFEAKILADILDLRNPNAEPVGFTATIDLVNDYIDRYNRLHKAGCLQDLELSCLSSISSSVSNRVATPRCALNSPSCFRVIVHPANTNIYPAPRSKVKRLLCTQRSPTNVASDPSSYVGLSSLSLLPHSATATRSSSNVVCLKMHQ